MSRAEGKRRAREEDDTLDALLEASEEYVPYVPLKQRKKGASEHTGHAVQQEAPKSEDEGGKTTDEEAEERERAEAKPTKKSLLDIKEEMKKRFETMDAKSIKLEMQKIEEQRILLEVGHCLGSRVE